MRLVRLMRLIRLIHRIYPIHRIHLTSGPGLDPETDLSSLLRWRSKAFQALHEHSWRDVTSAWAIARTDGPNHLGLLLDGPHAQQRASLQLQ